MCAKLVFEDDPAGSEKFTLVQIAESRRSEMPKIPIKWETDIPLPESVTGLTAKMDFWVSSDKAKAVVFFYFSDGEDMTSVGFTPIFLDSFSGESNIVISLRSVFHQPQENLDAILGRQMAIMMAPEAELVIQLDEKELVAWWALPDLKIRAIIGEEKDLHKAIKEMLS